MGFIEWDGTAKIYGTDKAVIQKSKAMFGFRCAMCNNKFQRGTICLGKQYTKFCLDCYQQVFKNILIEIDNFKLIMKNTNDDIQLNLEKYKAHNLACAI